MRIGKTELSNFNAHEYERVIVKLPNWMGDVLFSFDFLYSLTQKFKRVAFCTSLPLAELFAVFPFPGAEVVTYPPENWPKLDRESILKIDQFRADLGILLPNSFGSALLMRFAGVPKLLGYATEHRGFLLEYSVPPPTHRVHQTDYYLGLLSAMNIAPLSYPRPPESKREEIAIIHPGASKIERAWHLDRFLELAKLLKQNGLEVIFISGERIPTDSYACIVRPALSEFCNQLRRSRLFIGNDSGPLHLAQQCGTSVIGIYGPGDPSVTGPRAVSSNRSVFHSFPCSPCRQKFFHECSPSRLGKPFCIETISVKEVWTSVDALLKEGKKKEGGSTPPSI